MELFHQTVSMKSVGNLNDFVRDHMLEPFDAAEWIDELIAHFEDLTSAHEAVRRPRRSSPRSARCWPSCDATTSWPPQIAELTAQRIALRVLLRRPQGRRCWTGRMADISTERTALARSLTGSSASS